MSCNSRYISVYYAVWDLFNNEKWFEWLQMSYAHMYMFVGQVDVRVLFTALYKKNRLQYSNVTSSIKSTMEQ
jgi:hypothetical protein